MEQVVGERETCQGRSRFELSVQIIRDVAELDHLWHVQNISACDSHVKRKCAEGNRRQQGVVGDIEEHVMRYAKASLRSRNSFFLKSLSRHTFRV